MTDMAIYGRAREAGMPAKVALAIARNNDEKHDVPSYGQPIEFERDGFTLRAAMDYDEGMSLVDMGYGAFHGDTYDYRRIDWYGEYGQEPNLWGPDAVRNPHRDSRNPSGGSAWYVPGEGGTIRELAEYYNGPTYGASKSVAQEIAREAVMDELRRVTDDYGPSVYVLTVTALREDIELGSASVGGVELAYSKITRDYEDAYVWETINDLADEAISEAREALTRLVAV